MCIRDREIIIATITYIIPATTIPVKAEAIDPVPREDVAAWI